ncbi:hypothetical protein BDY19DRAFT_970529 [Irpex rosettiformis]|uniref:Uncharacterized protein n=1 Tax=Irpex rosettiformis TaxID=378272 RepID=A0ACB8TRQ3_9APHY|nr:hypothetical protein BDY19DRAFT_970529 [Irpex rosettiformis]
MGTLTLAYAISIFWLALHALHRFLSKRVTNTSILPTSGESHTRRYGSSWLSKSHIRVTLHAAHLKIETTGLNAFHDAWSSQVRKTSHARFKWIVMVFYDMGSVAGVAGMVFALGLLWVTAWKSSLSILGWGTSAIGTGTASPAGAFTKRDNIYEEASVGAAKTESGAAPLQLILPGVTVPLSHLPILFFALFFTQVIHELGHAITAALESVPLTSIGASLSLIIPSAFVGLPSAPVQALPPKGKLRLISSGAWHNLVFWLFLYMVAYMRIGSFILRSVGYTDVGRWGRVVVGVHEDSPLHGYLPTLSVITDLDDQSLTSADGSLDIWTSYLSSTTNPDTNAMNDRGLGWCVDGRWFLDHRSDGCCTPHESSSSAQGACFSADSSLEIERRCIPPLSVLQPSSSHEKPDDGSSSELKRCREAAHCASHSLCARLDQKEDLLRIKLVLPPSHSSREKGDNPSDEREIKTVVWSGPREELLEEVEVSTYLPRYAFLPLGVPNAGAVLFSYVSTLTLSLYLFNLLPLPYLDGSQLLEALFDFVQERTSINSSRSASGDLESGYNSSSTRLGALRLRSWKADRWRTKMVGGAKVISVGLMGLCVILGVWNAII